MNIIVIVLGAKNANGKTTYKHAGCRKNNIFLIRKNGTWSKTQLTDIYDTSPDLINFENVPNGVTASFVDCACEFRRYQNQERIVIFNNLEIESYIDPSTDGTISSDNKIAIKNKLSNLLDRLQNVESIGRNGVLVFYWYCHNFAYENNVFTRVKSFLKSFTNDYENEFGNFLIVERKNNPVIIKNLAD